MNKIFSVLESFGLVRLCRATNAIMVTVLLRAVPYDTKDDVVEKFLSKILPGSGTIYRSEHHRTSASSHASTGSTPPTATRQTDQRTSAAATGSPVVMEVKSALYQEAPSFHKRRVCKTVPMVSRDEHHVHVKIICYHVSDATAAP